jgi:hypothetical protein
MEARQKKDLEEVEIEEKEFYLNVHSWKFGK